MEKDLRPTEGRQTSKVDDKITRASSLPTGKEPTVRPSGKSMWEVSTASASNTKEVEK